MSPTFYSRRLALLGLGILAVLLSVGTVRAFSRGGNDFAVFFEAWRLVRIGHGADIYRVSPDRFLYAPGFAWLLSPLSFFSRELALGIWCFAKILVIGALLKQLSRASLFGESLLGLGLGAWGMILMARPLLIDFEYGQVNLLILGSCLWGLLDGSRKFHFLKWVLLTLAAFTKIYPLPLLLVPWLAQRGRDRNQLWRERAGIGVGALLILLAPFVDQGWQGTWSLIVNWGHALIAKGLPLESHNQSLVALLYRYLSGGPVHVLSEGVSPLFLGWRFLTSEKIALLSLGWTVGALGVILFWLTCGSRKNLFRWAAVLIGLLIVPSHLIWKPYFVLSIPLSFWMVNQAVLRRNAVLGLGVLGLFIVINLTGFDFVGHKWGAQFESASILFIAHLALISVAFIEDRWVSE